MTGTPGLSISHSRLVTWRRCRRKFWFSYGMGYVEPSNVGRKVGTVGHTMMTLWYRSDRSPDAQEFILQSAVHDAQKLDIPEKDVKRLLNALKRYFAYSSANDHWEVLDTEHHFGFSIGKHWFHGYIDLIVRDDKGHVFAVEHKFNQVVSTDHLALDPQSSLYIIGGQQFKVEGVLYNIIRVKDGPTAEANPVVREYIQRSADFQGMLINDLEVQIAEIERWEQSSHKARISYPNPTWNCSWDCAFHNACIAYSEAGDMTELSKLPLRETQTDSAESDDEG